MGVNKAKEEILKNIRNALTNRRTGIPEPNFTTNIFAKSEEKDLSIVFAEKFVGTKAQFVFNTDEEDFNKNFHNFVQQRNLKNIFVWEEPLIQKMIRAKIPFNNSRANFETAEAGVTSCESLIARTGSILISSKPASGRSLGIYPPMHIVVAYTSQVVDDIRDGLAQIREKYKNNIPSMISLETGPSRTADIEKTLVLGAHGPKELILFLIDDTNDQ